MFQILQGEPRALAENYVSWIVKGGLLLILFIPLLVTRSMYFPFITGKNFAFRILIEILAVFWVWLMAVSPRFRPRFSLTAISYIIFVAVLVLAMFFGLSPYKSFWSSYERMEGLFGHLHLFLYFLMAGSVFVGGKNWRLFFNASIAVSAIVTIYGFVQLAGGAVIHQGGARLDATLGNATYLAVYLLFHLFLIAIFFFQSKQTWLKEIYGTLFMLEAVILYYTASRGPLLGLLVGAVIFAVILGVLERGRIRSVAFGVLIVSLLAPVVFFFARNTEFVSSSDTLSRFTNMLSDPAAEGRLTIWKMAFRGWQERPILGWGQESFIYIFSKYYEPSLWRNEPWFDRAHNVFLDWLTASGILGLGAYLAMFGSALWLLFASFKSGKIDRFAFAGFSGLFSAHFFQNLFVFDNITSYIMFFSALAYVHSVAVFRADGSTDVKEGIISPVGAKVVFPIIALVAAVYSILMFNIQPMRAAGTIINSLVIAVGSNPAGKTDALVKEIKRGIDLQTFGTTEIREQTNQIGNRILQDQGIAIQDKQKYIEFVIEEMEKQIKEEPFDVRAIAFIANAYSIAGRPTDALSAINEAMKISTKRQQFYFVAAEAYLSKKEPDKAVGVLRTAYELDPTYTEAIHNLAIVLIISGKVKEGEDLVEKHFGMRIYPDQKYVGAYQAIGDTGKVVKVWEQLVASSTSNAQYRAELGSVYFQVGKKKEAIAEFQKAIEIEPVFKAQGEQIIKQIQDSMK
ncbi:MAG: O-antigen ligase family protein [bacterium]|nr:O-antigen ligase family protein [bacterium]